MLSHTPVLAPVVGVITDGFGPRLDPVTRQPAFHEGLDISCAIGTAVRAPADGVVVFAERESGYGKLLKINHGYGYSTTYGHLDRFLVKLGQKVTRGQIDRQDRHDGPDDRRPPPLRGVEGRREAEPPPLHPGRVLRPHQPDDYADRTGVADVATP